MCDYDVIRCMWRWHVTLTVRREKVQRLLLLCHTPVEHNNDNDNDNDNDCDGMGWDRSLLLVLSSLASYKLLAIVILVILIHTQKIDASSAMMPFSLCTPLFDTL